MLFIVVLLQGCSSYSNYNSKVEFAQIFIYQGRKIQLQYKRTLQNIRIQIVRLNL